MQDDYVPYISLKKTSPTDPLNLELLHSIKVPTGYYVSSIVPVPGQPNIFTLDAGRVLRKVELTIEAGAGPNQYPPIGKYPVSNINPIEEMGIQILVKHDGGADGNEKSTVHYVDAD